MRAAVRDRYGPPDVVRIEDLPVPTPKDDDVVVAVHASTVNRTDCHYRSGRPLAMRAIAGWLRPRARVLGTEYAGVVHEVGPSATGFAPGDRVTGWIEGRFGAHAEFVAAASSGPIAKVPETHGLLEAAALTEGTHYALSSLRRLDLQPGATLLVYGATGSIGSAAVQLAKGLGLRVTAVGPTARLEVLSELGADRVLSYETGEHLREAVRYDAVFDAWGHAPFFGLRHLLAPHGQYVSTGAGAHKENGLLVLAAPLMRRKVRFAYPKIDRAMVEGFAREYGDGTLRPLIDRRFDLEEIVDAYRYVETGTKLGNVLLVVRDEDPGARTDPEAH